ncbi:MarR family winged helix-turn-helix transcriptional regulator [Deinococcus planocerae]|uniref:MarR family winged helix-turn-helix transcriptional regulator n=1 Tax=Deinococcus planocerae TaxID=1737569 RepID=UPI000C7EBA15|nr:MarR family winged helix-turn-helix transcriptional regulator [Deinococcus planocerae]
MNHASPSHPELYDLVRLTLRLSRRFLSALDEPLEAALGLNTKELLVLAAIMDGAGTPGAVAERQRLPAPTVTRIVTKLVGRGLVERVTDPGDLRRQRLRLTPQGEATRGRTRATAQDIVDAHFGALPAEHVGAALAALRALEADLRAAPTTGEALA